MNIFAYNIFGGFSGDKVLDETRRLVLSQSYCVQHSPFDFGSHYKESTSSDVQVPQQFQTDESFSKPEAIVLVCGALSAGKISNWFAMLYFLRAALTNILFWVSNVQ